MGKPWSVRSDRGESPCNGRASLAEGEDQHRPFIGELGDSVSSKTVFRADLRRDIALLCCCPSCIIAVSIPASKREEDSFAGIRDVEEMRIVFGEDPRETTLRHAKT